MCQFYVARPFLRSFFFIGFTMKSEYKSVTLLFNVPNLKFSIQSRANQSRKIINDVQVEYNKNDYADAHN